MANPNKAKGTRWESDVTNYLRSHGLPAVKPRQEGNEDVGDIHVGRFVLQCKDWRDVTAATREGVEGAARQSVARANRAGTPWAWFPPVAVVKRARKGTGDGYVTMTLETVAVLAQDHLNP